MPDFLYSVRLCAYRRGRHLPDPLVFTTYLASASVSRPFYVGFSYPVGKLTLRMYSGVFLPLNYFIMSYQTFLSVFWLLIFCLGFSFFAGRPIE